jgi:copper homeostasis protein
MKKVLEICCDGIESVMAAKAGGADRIELCANLDQGGTTPSAGLIQLAVEQSELPVFVLIRPRPGDFCYSHLEFEQMLCDIRLAHQHGAAGIVSGILMPDHTIDRQRTRQLIHLSRPLPFTFHRAFDRCMDPLTQLNTLIDLGVDRLLTSGQAPSAPEGKERLQRLKQIASGKLTILAGGGIRPSNLVDLLDVTEISEFHSSARVAMAQGASSIPGLNDDRQGVSSEIVRNLRQLMDNS